MDNQKSLIFIAGILIAGLLIGKFVSGQAIKQTDNEEGGGCSDYDSDRFFGQSGCGSIRDCDDNNPNVYPGAEEICGNNIDDNCDGESSMCEGSIEIVSNKPQYYQGEKILLR